MTMTMKNFTITFTAKCIPQSICTPTPKGTARVTKSSMKSKRSTKSPIPTADVKTTPAYP